MRNEQPALVILTPGFPANEEDGACLPPQQLFIKSLNKLNPGLRLLIVSFQYPFTRQEYLWNTNSVFAFGGKNRPGIQRLLLWRRIRKTLNRLHQENNIKGLLSFWCGECSLVGKQWAVKNNIRYYHWIMGQDADKTNQYVKRIRPGDQELIAISDFIKEEFQKNHNITPKHIIPIGVKPQSGPGKRDIDILCAGSLIPLKQYHISIEIAAKIKDEFPSLKMVLCGKGPEEEKIRSLIKEYRLENNVSLVGEKNHSEVLDLMNQCKLFLHPSSYEGFGIVCLEALAAGAPVISFCQPMKTPVKKWHIVNSPAEMKEKVVSILRSAPDYTPVHPYQIDDTARNIMKLFSL